MTRLDDDLVAYLIERVTSSAASAAKKTRRGARGGAETRDGPVQVDEEVHA